jgi:hypothetical protein
MIFSFIATSITLIALWTMSADTGGIQTQTANAIPLQSKVELVCSVANGCLSKVELGKGASCSGPDLQHLICQNLVVTYKPQFVENHVTH